MSSVTSRTFVVHLEDHFESTFRAARRVTIHADILKSAKLCAGDVVAVSGATSTAKVRLIQWEYPTLYLEQLTQVAIPVSAPADPTPSTLTGLRSGYRMALS